MTAVGTPLFVAPEVARGEIYDESVDVSQLAAGRAAPLSK